MHNMAVSLFGATAKQRKLSESAPEPLARNAATPKDFIRKSPRSIVIEVEVEGHIVCALIDTGSRADFMSSNLTQQLKLKRDPLAKPLTVQLAVQGSTSKVNYSVDAHLVYQEIDEQRRFDILNVDGNGNRVAALTFGPSKTVVVVGVNKIVRDLDEAFARLESYASPMNNKRLDRPNPCVKTGLCEDCQGETRICRAYQILRRKPSLSDFTVIVVGESLGY